MRAYYNGSLEISETYNRITLDNQQKFTPPILLFTVVGDLFCVPLVAEDAAGDVAVLRQRAVDARPVLAAWASATTSSRSMLVPLIVVLAIADDVHIVQHWDEERRHGAREQAFKADRRAPGGAAARRQRAPRRSACCRSPPATSWRCGRSASDRPSASWSTSSSRSC